MKLVEIDEFEDNGGEYALKDDNFLVLLKSGNTIDGDVDFLPGHTETDKSLREIFGEGGPSMI